MRRSCLIAILFAFFAPIKSHANIPIPDYLIYNGKGYPLTLDQGVDIFLFPYLLKPGKWEKWQEEINKGYCSALPGGYYTIFEIVDNELVLANIANCFESLLKEFLSIYEIKDTVFKLDWFTGSIIIGVDKVKRENYTLHEYYSVLHFEKGILIKEIRTDFREYLSIRLKRNLERLEAGDFGSTDEEFMQSMRKNFEDRYQRDLEQMEHYHESGKGDKSKFLANLKAEYERKFKKSISDFELAIQEIRFWDEYRIEATRTLNGVRVSYRRENPREVIDVKLSLEKWLDFINALSNCCFDKWKRPYPSSTSFYNGSLSVCSSSKDKYRGGCYNFHVEKANLPDLEEFKKVMEDFVTEIKKAGGK